MNDVELWDLVLYFLRLEALGFGGPIALAGYSHRDLVQRGWITEEEYAEGLAFAQMMPGPLAAQLAMWIGYIARVPLARHSWDWFSHYLRLRWSFL